jgi:hypothetical protein
MGFLYLTGRGENVRTGMEVTYYVDKITGVDLVDEDVLG